jgi:hypothetical protein
MQIPMGKARQGNFVVQLMSLMSHAYDRIGIMGILREI